jgi:pyruvate dehydrogenase E1 component beta subunit
MASDIGVLAATKVFDRLKAPVRLVTSPHTPVPFAAELEARYAPDAQNIEQAVREIMV